MIVMRRSFDISCQLAATKLIAAKPISTAARIASTCASRILVRGASNSALSAFIPSRVSQPEACQRSRSRSRLDRVWSTARSFPEVSHLPHLLMEELAPCTPEAELNVLSGEHVTVVELEALAELELVDRLVRAQRPELGKARGQVVPRHRFDQRVVQGIEHPERGDHAHQPARVEPGGGQGNVQRPAHLAFGIRLGW